MQDALAAPGVEAVWTAADVADIPPIGFRQASLPELTPYRQPVMGREIIRYVGEPIAAVFADDAYVAEDAAERVHLELEELTPQLDVMAEPALFDEINSTEAAVIHEQTGDIARAFGNAHTIVGGEFAIGRHSGVPMETRGASARFDPLTGVLEMFGAAKVPYYNRDAIASMLGLSPGKVVLREGHVGGGFGVRGELYPEDVLLCAAALRLRRPVKWIEDRREHLMAANHSRDQIHHIKAAVDESGRLLGIVDEFWLDQGAYVRTHAATVPTLTATMLPGPYALEAYEVTGHIRLTNKTPAGTYRSPGRYESTFAAERLMDLIAVELGLDPSDVRRINLITSDDMPYPRGMEALGTEVTYDSGDYPRLLERVLAHIDYDELKADLARRRATGENVGLGLGFFVEKSGLGPYAGVEVAVGPDGSVIVTTGEASMGQGIETVLAQICSSVLDVAPEGIEVRHGQTDEFPAGMGAFASRVTVMAGSATLQAAERVRQKAFEVAAEKLEARSDDLVLEDGRVFVSGSPAGPSLTLGEIAAVLDPATSARYGWAPGLRDDFWFHTDHMTYPYGLHVVLARVDPEAGGVELLRYLVAYDVGRAINPMLIEGQIAGGAAQGVGGALLEEFRYSEEGQPLATSFADYLMPTLSETPDVEAIISEDAPSPLNPLGVKGAGEGGTNAAGAAIAAAVSDAIGNLSAVTRIPISPERLRELIRRQEEAAQATEAAAST
jgi:CO/xanthine dehydrogenase Mo-binding subunit